MINVKTFAGVATVALSLAFGMGSAAASFVTGSATVNGVGQLQFQPVGSVGSPPGDYTGVSFAASSNQFTVGGASSDLSGLAGATGTIKDFTYVPFSSITNFLLILSPSASFDATSISTSSGPFGNGWSADGQFLNLSITGILHLSGFDDTTATLAFAGTFTNAQTISWSGSLAAAGNPPVRTPEPATLALIGAGLAGMGMMRRRKAKTA